MPVLLSMSALEPQHGKLSGVKLGALWADVQPQPRSLWGDKLNAGAAQTFR